ncbi:MAG: hypothetical protein COS88_02550 [Chloroflexi bacterium CG07_land_8_20_14_0_80_51_10]|nr:MAG: hypothetical protein COS88_02550 [Chloroflexi bacterium CG07_land_8_20_14_0_80_51_10]
MQSKSIFDEVLDKASSMPLEDQDMMIEILKNRATEKRREEISKNAEETLEEYKRGLTSKGSVADLLKELESD